MLIVPLSNWSSVRGFLRADMIRFCSDFQDHWTYQKNEKKKCLINCTSENPIVKWVLDPTTPTMSPSKVCAKSAVLISYRYDMEWRSEQVWHEFTFLNLWSQHEFRHKSIKQIQNRRTDNVSMIAADNSNSWSDNGQDRHPPHITTAQNLFTNTTDIS